MTEDLKLNAGNDVKVVVLCFCRKAYLFHSQLRLNDVTANIT